MRHLLQKGSLSACLIVLATIALFSCHKSTPTPATDTPPVMPPNSAAVAAAANQFAFSIFHSILQSQPANVNKLISPLSIFTALSMTYNGAAGATQDSMALALQQKGIAISDLNAFNQALITQLPKEDSKVQLSIANSIWYSKAGAQPAPAFLDLTKTDYLSTMQAMDFTQSVAAVNTINSWVAKNTNNKIPGILDRLDPATLMILINAVYFNAPWLHGFQPEATHNQPFTLGDGSTVSTPFMFQEMYTPAWFGPTFTFVELPYSTGKGFSMYLAIPIDNSWSIADFVAAFTRDSLTNAYAHMDSTFVGVSLPRWEYPYSIPILNDELTALGMGIAFGSTADFSGMYPNRPLHISQVAHKAYIKVSEEGTEAAAVTSVGTTATLVPAAWPVKADHPFLYLITEKQTGTVLFLGIVADPTQH
jgi:serpin B